MTIDQLLEKLQIQKAENFSALVMNGDCLLLPELMKRSKEHGYEIIVPRDEIGAREKARRMANRRGWPEEESLGVQEILSGVFIVKNYKLSINENKKPVLKTK